ncbi:hypothetical protein J7E93_07550 [Streptomyces sp. ISL-36]|uniref:hypothetical protein n=1 Tax=Streptomyces sp. ISL-36 TaxID=2819182 RepID=UPI001BE8206D|nr:hypothetical protein [Streptomyces sp. ISL-36]MBT2439977.1 hypothetical protein [Streptomyces sp. ISL-36]
MTSKPVNATRPILGQVESEDFGQPSADLLQRADRGLATFVARTGQLPGEEVGPARGRGDRAVSTVQKAPTAYDMTRDSDLAVTLATYGIPTGPVADQLRERLRGYIVDHLAEPAGKYADSLADSRAKDIAKSTVEHALRVAGDRGGNPEANLRLLGKSVGLLLRYASDLERRQAH